jgi:glutathione synthase/RimK-type ligase-like ATP-grasp enzyme
MMAQLRGSQGDIEANVERARDLAWRGDDEAAKRAYVEALRRDPTHFEALNDLGALAHAGGHRSAARIAYAQAVRCHPANPIGRVNLANVLVEDGEPSEAERHYRAALDVAFDFPEAHQGLARVFAAVCDERAERHWRGGFAGRPSIQMACRGVGPAVPALLLASVRLGNMPTRQWLDDRLFSTTVIHLEFWDLERPLPPHAVIVNLVGDADLCGEALTRAEMLVERGGLCVINPPARVRATSRAENARRLRRIPDVITPTIETLPRADVLEANGFAFPLLLRAPGFHTGQHFLYVETRDDLANAVASLPGRELMAIRYLDARGSDGLARKYRVMFIDGKPFPLHLAVSADWKVHYFTSAMADSPAHRDEERRFLEDMPGVLGERATRALLGIRDAIGLDYFGVDFALAPDGSVLVFEANATMVAIAPPPEPIWDYRRRPVADVLEAAKRLALSRALRPRAAPSGPPSDCDR